MGTEIDELRNKIDKIDTQLIRLLDERIDIALEIGILKKNLKLGVEQNGRENVVLERAMAAKYPESAVAIFQSIMNSSKVEQTRKYKIEKINGDLKIGIIGFGRFGQFMAKHLSQRGRVEVWDRNDRTKEAKEVGVKFVSFDEVVKNPIVIISTSMESIDEMLDKMKGKLTKGQLIIDVCSLKVFACELMKKKLPSFVEILGTHPLFGPQSAKFGICGAKIALCPVRISEEKVGKIKEFCESLGLNVFLTTPEEHDRQMAASQALTHFVGQALHHTGIKRVELSTKTFDSLMDVVDIIKNDSPELFRNMQEMNPFADNLRKKFIDELDKIEKSLEKK